MRTPSYDINQIERGFMRDPDFPHAPPDWNREQARRAAKQDGIKLTEEHWQVIRALQEYYSRHEDESLSIHMRELHDALDETFHAQGGIRHLYQLLPGGPIAQGCRLAGLEAPAGAADASFGSVA